ncbi:tripartite tricarboxylate transporter substrate binding protein [soil metagenome]
MRGPWKALIPLGLMVLACFSTVAEAQAWPTKPIHLIIPWPVGGYADSLGRLVAQRLSENLGQPIVVDNKGGSNGLIGAGAAAMAVPDGYTLMFHSVTSHVINPALYAQVPYGPKDLLPITIIAATPLLLVANNAFPAANTADALKLARENKDKPFAVASFGAGSGSHLALELLKQQAHVELLHVPYRGGGPALMDTVAGNVPLYFAAFGLAQPLVAQGKLRALAVTGKERVSTLPDVPTLAESAGLPNFSMTVTYALWAPAHVPAPIVKRISDEMNRIVVTSEFQERLKIEGAVGPVTTTPEQAIAFTDQETRRLTDLVKTAGIKLD